MEKLRNLTEQNMTYIIAGNESGDGTNPTNHDFKIYRSTDDKLMEDIHFQQGPISEEGVNGILNEDLMMILIDRVESFQRSKLRCRENEIALQHLHEALFWFNMRNNKRH